MLNYPSRVEVWLLCRGFLCTLLFNAFSFGVDALLPRPLEGLLFLFCRRAGCLSIHNLGRAVLFFAWGHQVVLFRVGGYIALGE